MSDLSNWLVWLWALNVGVQIGLCYLIVRRGAFRHLPFLFLYLLLNLVQAATIFVSYQRWGFSSRASYAIAWLAQAFVVAVRGAAVAEICRNCLRAYQGISAFGWRILTGVGMLVALYAGFSALIARHKAFWVTEVVLAADRGLALALAAVLLALLLLARYYGVQVNQPHKALAVWFCFYSCVLVLNNTFLSVFLHEYASLWNGIGLLSYFLALAMWWRALYRFAPVLSTIPMLGSQTAYDEYAPQFNSRLRLLNDRLAQVLKS